MNLSTVKWPQWDKTQSGELLGLFICVCFALCATAAHNIAQNRPDNFPSYPPDNHHCSDDVYLREGGGESWMTILCHCYRHRQHRQQHHLYRHNTTVIKHRRHCYYIFCTALQNYLTHACGGGQQAFLHQQWKFPAMNTNTYNNNFMQVNLR